MLVVETCFSVDSEKKDVFIFKDKDEQRNMKTSRAATRKTRKKDVVPVVELKEMEKTTVYSVRKVRQKEMPLRDPLTNADVLEIKTADTLVRTTRTARRRITQARGEEQKNSEEVSAKGSNLQNVTLNQNMASHAQQNKNRIATRTRARTNRAKDKEQTKVNEEVSSKIVPVKKCATNETEDRNASTEIINRADGTVGKSIRTRGALKRNKTGGRQDLQRVVNGEVSSKDMIIEKPTTEKSGDENIDRRETEEAEEAVRTTRGARSRPVEDATVSLNVAKHTRRTRCGSKIEKAKVSVKETKRTLRTIKKKAEEEQMVPNNSSDSKVNEPEEEKSYVESNEKDTLITRRGRPVRYIRGVDKSNNTISNKLAVDETETNGKNKTCTTKSSTHAKRSRMPLGTSVESGSAVDPISLDEHKTDKESGGASHDTSMKKSVKTYPKRHRISRELKSDENNSKDVFVSSNCQVRKKQSIVGADTEGISVFVAQDKRITRSRKAASKEDIPEIQDKSISESELKNQRSGTRLLRSQLKPTVTHSDEKQTRGFRPLENGVDIHNNTNGNPESAIMLSRKSRRVRNAKQTIEDFLDNDKSEPVMSRRRKRVKGNDVEEPPAETSPEETRLSSKDVENIVSKSAVLRVPLENDPCVESGMARNAQARNKQGRENGSVMNVKKVESRKNKLLESEDIISEPPPKRRALRQKAALKDPAPENIVEPGIRRSSRRKR